MLISCLKIFTREKIYILHFNIELICFGLISVRKLNAFFFYILDVEMKETVEAMLPNFCQCILYQALPKIHQEY